MKMVPKTGCICEQPPLHYLNYIQADLGIDATNNRYGEVSIDECIHCRRKWLHYFVEYAHYSRSGRWYRGIISGDDIPGITPENAVQYIENLDWYLFGGSFFETRGAVGKGKARVD